MNNPEFSWALFTDVPLVGIIRNIALADVEQLLPIYNESGLTTVEITLNTPGAADMIRYALDTYGKTLNIGAGTVCSLTELETALTAGAQFIVTPVVNPPVIEACKKRSIPIFVGAFTPSEIYQAWDLGASMVKVYPASTLGPDYLKHVKAPLDQIKLLPTGGITIENVPAFMKAGANGVGVGSPLFVQQHIHEKNWTALADQFKAFYQAIRE